MEYIDIGNFLFLIIYILYLLIIITCYIKRIHFILPYNRKNGNVINYSGFAYSHKYMGIFIFNFSVIT